MTLSRYAPEVREFYSNVIANGGSINTPTLAALSQFVRTLQGRAALWSLIDEIYPLVGSGLPAACTKLKYTATPYLTNHNFTADDFEEWGPTSGLKGDAIFDEFAHQQDDRAIWDATEPHRLRQPRFSRPHRRHRQRPQQPIFSVPLCLVWLKSAPSITPSRPQRPRRNPRRRRRNPSFPAIRAIREIRR